MRLYVTAAILAGLMAAGGYLYVKGGSDAKERQKAAQGEQYIKERRAIDNADVSQGNTDIDRSWLNDASKRLSGPR